MFNQLNAAIKCSSLFPVRNYKFCGLKNILINNRMSVITCAIWKGNLIMIYTCHYTEYSV